MRVLLINACHYRRGGSEMVYFNTAHLLKAHGHSIAFFSTKDTRNEKSDFDKYFISNGNFREFSLLKKIERAPSYLFNVEAGKNLEKLVIDYKPDIAHVHIFYGALSVSILKMLKKYRIPVVHTVHDYRLLCPVNTLIDKDGNLCERCKDKHYYHCLLKRCSDGQVSQSAMVMLEAYYWKYFLNPIKYIDHFIFVSNFSKNKHLEFNKNFRERFTQIYNFTNYSNHEEIINNGDYYLYFGRLSVEKGIETLLKVFSRKRKHKLKIAGTGPLKALVEEVSRVNSNIEYEGFKSCEELESLIKNSSFVIIPSECYENNPLALVEAYNFGKPIIGAEIAGIPELVNHTKNGFLFKSGNADSLESMVDASSLISSDEYTDFSKSVKDFANEHFSSESHYLRLLKVYTDAIDKEHTK